MFVVGFIIVVVVGERTEEEEIQCVVVIVVSCSVARCRVEVTVWVPSPICISPPIRSSIGWWKRLGGNLLE